MGLLVTAQFFVGTEILVMFALVVACCFVIIAVFWVKQPDRSMDQIRYAATGLLVGLGVSVVLLAYPCGSPSPDPHIFQVGSGRSRCPTSEQSGRFHQPVRSAATPVFGASFTREYLGLGLVVVCLAGFCVWRKDKKLQLAAAGAGISLLLSLGASHRLPLPWSIFGSLPLLQSIIPSRFIIVAYLALAVMLGLIVDHVYVAVAARSRQPLPSTPA